MMLRRLQQAGHKPIVLMGGGTTKVGDPSGKDESRKLLTDEEIDANIAGIRRVFERFLTFGDGPTDAIMVNNADWLDTLEYIPFLRDVGPAFHDQPDADLRQRQAAARPRAAADLPRIQLHDPPGLRLPRAVAARRLPAADGRLRPVGQYRQRHRAGAPDRRHRGVRRHDAADHHRRRRQDGQDRAGRGVAQRRAARAPTITGNSGGTRRTPTSGRFLRLFTDLPLDEIARLEALPGAEINEAKIVLATEATAMLHGREAAEAAAQTAARRPSRAAARARTCRRCRVGDGMNIAHALTALGFTPSNRKPSARSPKARCGSTTRS